MKKRIISSVLVIALMLSCIITANYSVNAVNSEKKSSSADSSQSTSASYNLADSVDEGVILQAWNWSYKNIEAKLETLASLGYTTIQVSPPNTVKEATTGQKVYQGSSAKNGWWMFYQPAGFQLNERDDNALGTKSELASMVEKAHSYGMKVIVDAVINHLGTNGDESATMLANTNTIEHVTPMANTYAKEIMDANAFHNPFFDMTYKEDASQYTHDQSVYDLTRGSTSHLPDLDTSSKVVQNAILGYFKECIDIGIDGFRIDAAKHIETPDDGTYASDFWPTVVGGANTYAQTTQNKKMFYYGEILNTCGVGRAYSSYLKYIEITDSSTYYNQFNAVNGSPASYTGDYSNGMTKANAITWSESHDIYMDSVAANSVLSTTTVNKRWALVAARDNTAMYFARPSNAYSTTIGDADDTAWNSTEVKAVNKFHNAMSGESEYISNSGNFAYNERGTTGIMIVNCSGTTSSVSIPVHRLAAGTYTDQITGNTFTCTGTTLSGQMGSTGIVAIYPETSPKVTSNTDSGKYFTDTLSLTLSAKNVDKATYEYNGSTPVEYTSGQTVSIGSAADTKGATYKVTLKGYSGTEVAVEETYVYTKAEKQDSYSIKFTPGSTWSTSTVNCYAWNNASQDALAKWPGTAMTANGDGSYSCTISGDYDRIIFNTGSSGKQTVDITVDSSTDYTLTGQTTTNSGGTTCYLVNASSSGSTDPTYYPGQDTTTAPTTVAPTTVAPTTVAPTTVTTEPTTETVEPTTVTEPATTEPSKYSVGDVNRDGTVNIADATLIQKYLVGLSTLDAEQISLADFNESGKITVKDATAIQYSLLSSTPH